MAGDTYEKLRGLLNENKQWPMLYLFKFIIPNTDGKVEMVAAKMPTDGSISYKHTANLKYVSLTCKARMGSAESIIQVLSLVAEIPGVMVL